MSKLSDNNTVGTQSEIQKAILDAYHEAMILINSQGKILQVNKKVKSIFDFDDLEILGKQIETVVPEALSVGSAEEKVFTAIRKDHSEIRVHIKLNHLEIGSDKLIALFIKDVPIKETLKNRSHKMVGEIQDYSIVFLNAKGQVTDWNKGVERILGYGKNDLTTKNFRIFFSNDDQSSLKPEMLLETASINGRAEHECWLQRKDGSLFWASVILTAIYDPGNDVIGYSNITRDLTERINLEQMIRTQAQKLQARNKELENFTYIASHDLQEPLSTVTSMIELIREESEVPFTKDIDLYFSFIEEASERMRSLIKGLLNYARQGRNKELASVNLQKLVEDLKADLSIQIKRQKALIEVIDPLSEVKAYSVEFRMLLKNIICNSLKFSSLMRKPHIKVYMSDENDYWKVAIEDNGIGIKEKFLSKIFIIFQRLNEKNLYEGDGIGLAHCKKIIDIHEGDIWAESEFGKSTTIHFTISKNLKSISGVTEIPTVAIAS